MMKGEKVGNVLGPNVDPLCDIFSCFSKAFGNGWSVIKNGNFIYHGVKSQGVRKWLFGSLASGSAVLSLFTIGMEGATQACYANPDLFGGKCEIMQQVSKGLEGAKGLVDVVTAPTGIIVDYAINNPDKMKIAQRIPFKSSMVKPYAMEDLKDGDTVKTTSSHLREWVKKSSWKVLAVVSLFGGASLSGDIQHRDTLLKGGEQYPVSFEVKTEKVEGENDFTNAKLNESVSRLGVGRSNSELFGENNKADVAGIKKSGIYGGNIGVGNSANHQPELKPVFSKGDVDSGAESDSTRNSTDKMIAEFENSEPFSSKKKSKSGALGQRTYQSSEPESFTEKQVQLIEKSSLEEQAVHADGDESKPEIVSKYATLQKITAKKTASTQQKLGNSNSPKTRIEASASRANLEGLKGTAQSKSHTTVQESSTSKAATGKTSPKTQTANTDGKSTPEVAAKGGAYQEASAKNTASTQQKSGNLDYPKTRTKASASKANLEGLKGTAQSKSHTSVQESSISKASTGKTSPKTQAANTDGKSIPEVASKDGAHQKAPVKNTASPQQKSGNSDSPKSRTKASASRSNLDGLKGTAQSKSHTSVQESSISKASTGKTSRKKQAPNRNGRSTSDVAYQDVDHQKA
ncbi:hypothetical protein, partial [Halodesulfovibrio sp.]|uniref:hypothetical protein n=1 Tax=Halodesulfovibrio sp. TaxID=1912772 RepID=UPI0025B9B147